MKTEKLTLESLAKETSKIKVNNNLRNSLIDAPFFKIKMEKAAKMLSVTELPKGY